MKAPLLIISIFFLLSGLIKAQTPPWVWAQEANSTGSEYGWDVACDTTANVIYVGGTFDGNLSAKYGASFNSSYGQDDGFLAKYTTNGVFQWALKVGGTTNDQIKGVAVDPLGNVYVCGFFTGTADFDPSAASFNLTASSSKDGFLAKYSSTGTFLWAVKYGGGGDDEPWKMYADGNGIYLTGSYSNAPATFYSYGSGVTRVTTSGNSTGEVFGAKYNSAGIAQWVISGGGGKADCGYNVVADANNAYFIGRYDEDIVFRNSSGTASAVLQSEQNNEQQVFIIAYTQSTGAFVWQTNITCSQGGDDVVGWGIAQDASNLYVSGYLEGNINFKYPSPTLTQTHTGGGSFDIFLAKLTKTGTFVWRAPVTGSGGGEQVGRAVEVDPNGDIILTGHFMNTLNYTASGGPTLSASAKDIFVASYSNSGAFQWATKAGVTGDDLVYGMTVDNTGGIYITGDHDNGAVFGAYTLTDSGSDNIYVAKLGCTPVGNNTISANQTICSGNAPSSLSGSLPTGSGTYVYAWEMSPDNSTWTNATGTYTNQNYAPSTLTVSTYFRRNVSVTGSCANTSISSPILILVDAQPTASNAGISQTLCASSATLNANNPTTGTGLWTVTTGTGSVTSPSSNSTNVTGLSNGVNNFVWTISNGTCPSSSSTVTVTRDLMPTTSNAGTSQTLCASSSTLVANAPTTGTGLWTVTTGTGSVTNPNAASTNVTGLSNGVNNFVWTISNGVCPSSSSTVTVTRDVPPTISNAGTSQTLCASSTTLLANVPTTGTGLWTVTTGTGSVTNPNAASTNVTGLSNGVNNFVWTISNGVCPSSSSTVTVTRDVPPTISNAGTSQTLCASSTTLLANTPAIGSGIWSVISGSGTVTATNNPSSNVSGLSDGNNDFVWTISNGTCPSSSSTVTVTQDVPPTISNAGTSQTLCASSTTLLANVPTTGTGLWTVTTGTGSVTSPNAASTNVTGLSNGVNNFVWTISNGTCPSSSSTVTVTRDLMPTVSNAGTSQTLCASSTTLLANVPTTGTGLWTVSTGTGSVTSPSSNSTNVTGLSNGVNNFVWTISNGTCPSSSSTVSVTRDVPPTISNAGTSQTLCASSTTLVANAPTTGTGLWTVATGTGSVTNPNTASTNVTGLSNGINNFVWTISNGTCPSSSSTITVTRDLMPTVSNAGTSQTLCASTTTLSANTPTTGTGLWTVATGTGSVTSPSSNSTNVTGLSNGVNNFVWTISNGTCPSSSSTVTITRDVPPTISNAGTSQTLCASSTTLVANAPTTGTGLWTVATGTGSVTSPSSNSTNATGLSNGINNFVWTISNGTCPSSSSTVTVTRDVPPTISNAGTSQTLCASSTTLNANTPAIGSGIWSVISGSGTVTATNNPSSNVSGLSDGSNDFVWTITNGVCPSSSSTVTITKDASPTISNAGTSQTLCASSTTLVANAPTTGTGLWTVSTGTGSVTNPNAASTNVTGLSNGINNFVWTISNGTCPSSSSTVSVTRDLMPTVSNAGTSQTLCATTTILNANNPSIGSGIWSVISGSGTVTATNNPSSNVSGLSDGSNDFVWTITNGVCPSSSSTVTITKDASPTISNAGASQTLCAASTTLLANAPTTGTGLWTVSTGTGSVTNPNAASTNVTGLSDGNNNFVWTISNGTCPSSSSTVTITRDVPPTISNAGMSQTLCASSTTLLANAPTNGTGLWTVATGTGSVTSPSSNSTNATGLSNGVNNFVWTITNGVCPSSSSTVTITKDASPTISNAGASQTLCSSSTILLANAPTTGTGLWTVSTGTGSVTSPSSNSTNVTGLSNGTNSFVWTISNGTCPSSSSTVTVTRDLMPTVSNAGTSQTLCVSTTTLNANNPTIGSGVWSVISGSGNVTSINNPSSDVSGLSDGNNDFVWTISNGTCPSSSSTVTITKDVSPSVPNAGSNQTICSSVTSLNGSIPVNGTAVWTVIAGSGSISNPGFSSSSVTGLSIGNNQFVWTISNGICPALSDTVLIIQDEMPSVSFAGTDKTICSTIDNLTANLPVIGSGVWTIDSGNGVVSDPGSHNSSVSNLSVGVNSFVWSISNGVCPVSHDTVKINVDAAPTLPNAGTDRTICSDNFVLQANVAVTGSGNWSLISGSGIFQNPTLHNTMVSSLGIGTTIFRWTIQNGVCPVVSDEVTIVQDELPSVALVANDMQTDFPVADLVAVVPVVGIGSWSVIEGPAEISNASQPIASATNLGIGNNVFRWTVTNGVCPESTDDILVELNPLKIPNAFSPNEDGINDAFVIPGLEYYRDVKFSVFNRWSALLYENNNYKNEWTGLNASKEKLADDTYYYILELPSIEKKYTGFIIIKSTK